MSVHQSPVPTHPPSRVSLSQWKLLASEWEAGSKTRERKKKKKNQTTLCFLYHATTGNSLELKALHTRFVASPAFSVTVNSRGRLTDKTAELTRMHAATHLHWLLKIPPRVEHVLCKQVEVGHLKEEKKKEENLRWLQAYRKFRNVHSVSVAVFNGVVPQRLQIRIFLQQNRLRGLWAETQLNLFFCY